MSLLGALISSKVLLATVLLGLGAVTEILLEQSILRIVTGHALLRRAWPMLFGPLLRAGLVVLFVLTAYPAQFGLRSAAPLATLLDDGVVAPGILVNTLFAASLLLPLVPGWPRRSAALFVIQGLLATALVFDGYAGWLGATSVSAWPGLGAAGAITTLAWLNHQVGEHAGRLLGEHLERRCGRAGFTDLVPRLAVVLAQVPTLVAYAYLLGRQLAI